MRLEVFRVNHVAATNAITMTNEVSGLKSVSMMPTTIALNPVAWLGPVSIRIPLRMIEMTNNITNPANEKNIPRPINLAARMFYYWILTRRVNEKPHTVSRLKAMTFGSPAVAKIWLKSKFSC